MSATLYAYRHRRTGRLVTGTRFGRYPYAQRMEQEHYPPLLLLPTSVVGDMVKRMVSRKEYELVRVSIAVGSVVEGEELNSIVSGVDEIWSVRCGEKTYAQYIADNKKESDE